MKNLNVFTLAATDHLVQPEEFGGLDATASELAIFTDFRKHKPHLLDSYQEASEALEVMLAEDVLTKLVIDDHREFVGVISREDLAEHNLQLKQLALLVKRDELLVRDLMHPRENIRAISYNELRQASVADVVSTMKKSHQEYLLVVDPEAHHIRGVISAREIGRRLNAPVDIEKELTFVDIFTAIKVH